jgi:hypothetical protein
MWSSARRSPFDNAESRLTTYEWHVVGHDRLGETLEGERADFFERCYLFDLNGDPLSNQDLPIFGFGAKAGGKIAYRANRGVAGTLGKTDLA